MQVAEKHQTDRFRAVLAPLLLALLVVGFYWKLVLTNQYSWLESPDLANQVLPWMQFQAGEWHQGRVPLWDPTAWGGQPLLGQAQPGAAYPPNWIFYLAPRRLYWVREATLNWYFVLIRVFAALAMYALCRSLERSRAASILGGCLYALGGYVGHTMWPQHVNGAVWTPLVFLFLLRASRGDKPMPSALLSGFCLGMGWLAGHHQMNLLVSLAAGGLWCWIVWRDRSLWRAAGAWLAIAIAASALQTWPMAEYGSRALRWVGSPNDPVGASQVVPYNVHQQFSLPPTSLLGIFVPNIEISSPPYIGTLGFALALLGVALAWRGSREVRWLTVIAVCGLAFALGPATPLHGVLYSLVPLLEKARTPGAATLLFGLAAGVLAAFGLDAASRAENFAASRKAGWGLVIAGGVLTIAAFAFFATRFAAATDQRTIVPAAGALLLAAVLGAWRTGALSLRAGAGLAIGVALFELTSSAPFNLPHRSDPNHTRLANLSRHADIAAYLYKDTEPYRVQYTDEAISYNFGDWYGIETFNSYTASVTANTWGMDIFSPKGQDFFGIRYFLAAAPPRPDLVERSVSASGVKIFENRKAFPRVWAVHRAERAEHAPTAMNTLDLRNVAFTLAADPPAMEACAGVNDEVQMPQHQPSYVRMTAKLDCRGLVVLTDTFYPGWKATVDGRSAEIIEVYGGVRGVLVDAGEHAIEMRYRPMSAIGGGVLTALAALIAAWAFWRTIVLRDA